MCEEADQARSSFLWITQNIKTELKKTELAGYPRLLKNIQYPVYFRLNASNRHQ